MDLKQNSRDELAAISPTMLSDAELLETLSGMSWQQGTPHHRRYIQKVNIVIKMLCDKDNFINKLK